MTQFIRSLTPLMWGILLFSGAIALIGVALIALGASGDSEFTLFGQTIKSTNVGVTALFIAAVVAILLGRRIIGVIEKTTTIELGKRPDSILHRYERLRDGASTPEQNVSLIEEIANSNDPHKEKYLAEIVGSSVFSFLERAAAKDAIVSVQFGKRVINLFDRIASAEKNRLIAGLGIGDGGNDQRFWQAVFGLKYWRYLNRPNHPQYAEVQSQLAAATAGKLNLENLVTIRNELEP